MKQCFKCGQTKPLTEFYKHKQMADGRLNKCIECAKSDSHKYRMENIDSVRDYDRLRAKVRDPKAVAAQTKAWRAADLRRSRCHSAVARAMRVGRLVRMPCESCDSENSVAHHDDYDKPLVVRWLCQACHIAHHRAEKL